MKTTRLMTVLVKNGSISSNNQHHLLCISIICGHETYVFPASQNNAISYKQERSTPLLLPTTN